MKTQEQRMEILFSSRDGLSYRHIARKFGCDPRTAKKYIEHPELIGSRRQSAARTSIVDPHRDKIEAYLAEDPEYRATWIYDQLRKHGYSGSYELVKRVVRSVKGQRQQLAYERFETEPGQQAQVDFGEFAVTLADGTVKTYYLFAMILGYSRRLFAVILERCDLPAFLQAHLDAFAFFGGVPREILYDRMRNVFVRELCGKAQFTQGLLTLAVHYGFTPRVAPAYAAWVKGKIERPMDFLRESFWRGYSFRNIGSANADLSAWLAEKEQRVHGTTHERIDVRFAGECSLLLALPPQPCDVSLRLSRRVCKDCTISVEGNRYVVAHTLVGQDVMVRLKDRCLRIFAGADLIVSYEAPEDKGHLVEDPRFYAALRADRAMQERKFGAARFKGKGRARVKPTISPTVPRHTIVVEVCTPPQPYVDVNVERRSMDVYARLGGEVCYASSEVEAAHA